MDKMQAIRTSISKNELQFPKCFYASDEEGVIVLENLKSLGFKTVPKSPDGKQTFVKLYNNYNSSTSW